MLLYEAIAILRDTEDYVNYTERQLGVNFAGSLLTDLNDSINLCQRLRKSIRDTKAATRLGGEPLLDVIDAEQVLSQKVRILEGIAVREGLGSDQYKNLTEQLNSFRSSRNALRLSIERCLRETELLDE